MRVRTGRFEKLWSGESRDSQAVEVGNGHWHVQPMRLLRPPASCVGPAMRAARSMLAPSPRSSRKIVLPHRHCLSCSSRSRCRNHLSNSPMTLVAADNHLERRAQDDCRPLVLLVRPFTRPTHLPRPLLTSGCASSAPGFHPHGQISPGKNAILHRTTAASTSPGPWPRELRSHLPARPGRRRLRCGSCTSAHGLRSALPLHARSPLRSCASLASLWPARPGTCTPKIAPMLGAQERRVPSGHPFRRTRNATRQEELTCKNPARNSTASCPACSGTRR